MEILGPTVRAPSKSRIRRSISKLCRKFFKKTPIWKIRSHCSAKCQPPASRQPLIAPHPCRGKVSTLLRGRISCWRSQSPLARMQNLACRERGGRSGPLKLVEVCHLRCSVRPQLTDTEAALLRSQAGTMASAALTAILSKKEFRLAPQRFRILLFRHLRLTSPLSAHSCRCGRPVDILGPPPCSMRDSRGFGGVVAGSWRTSQHVCVERPEDLFE